MSLLHSVPPPRRSPLRIDRALIVLGISCLVICAFVTARAAMFQRHAKQQLTQELAESRSTPFSGLSSSKPAAPPPPPVTGEIIGRVDVPRLNLSAAVAEGDDDATLGKAVGHLPDTPLPWQPGNVAFAAHRDTLFRPLKDIQLNDEVQVVTTHGTYIYRVSKTEIVKPEDVWVLAPTTTPTLTLITCYPFSFIGHAPRRFIVQAVRVQPDPMGTPLKGTVSN